MMEPLESSHSTEPYVAKIDGTVDGELLTLRERSRRQRYARILDAANELFVAKGYDDVTTKEVAKRAGVGEATLFRYVASKEELLQLVVGEKIEKVLTDIEAADDHVAKTSMAHDRRRGGWYVDRILTIYMARIDFFLTDPDNVAQYVSSGLRTDTKTGRRSISQGDRIISRVTSLLTSGQDEHVIRSDIDASIVAQNINAMYVHEILRMPVRSFSLEGTWARMRARLLVQLIPLVIDDSAPSVL